MTGDLDSNVVLFVAYLMGCLYDLTALVLVALCTAMAYENSHMKIGHMKTGK